MDKSSLPPIESTSITAEGLRQEAQTFAFVERVFTGQLAIQIRSLKANGIVAVAGLTYLTASVELRHLGGIPLAPAITLSFSDACVKGIGLYLNNRGRPEGDQAQI